MRYKLVYGWLARNIFVGWGTSEYVFRARNDEDAWEKVRKHLKKVRQIALNGRVKIIELLRVIFKRKKAG